MVGSQEALSCESPNQCEVSCGVERTRELKGGKPVISTDELDGFGDMEREPQLLPSEAHHALVLRVGRVYGHLSSNDHRILVHQMLVGPLSQKV